MAKYNPKDDLEFMRRQFEMLDDDVLPSHKISPEILTAKLNNSKEQKAESKKPFAFRRSAMAMAFCAVVICVGVAVLSSNGMLNFTKGMDAAPQANDTAQDNTAGIEFDEVTPENGAGNAEAAEEYIANMKHDENLFAATSYIEVKAALQNANDMGENLYEFKSRAVENNPVKQPETGGNIKYEDTDGAAVPDDQAKTAETGEGIVEGDIIKASGEYVYFYTKDNVNIIKTHPDGTMDTVSKIPRENGEEYFEEMYVWENYLAVVYTDYSIKAEEYDTDGTPIVSEPFYPETMVRIYNIEDKENPEKVREFSQEGSYVSSRLEKGCVYLVSLTERKEITSELVTPIYRDSYKAGAKLFVVPENVLIPNEAAQNCFTTISAVSVEGRGSATRTIMSNVENIYCSAENLYIFNSIYDATSNDKVETDIYKIDYKDYKLGEIIRGTVEGRLLSSSSADEYNGYLRIAVTDAKGKNASIFVVNEKLEKAGELRNFFNGKSSGTVKFTGEKAYLSTTDKKDPFVVIDLSDPLSPKKAGEIVLPGYFAYLHSIDEAYMVGIGYNVEQILGLDTRAGVRISLLNVEKDREPKEVHGLVYGSRGSHSLAATDFKAFVCDHENKMFAIPITTTADADEDGIMTVTFSGIYVFKLENGAVSLAGKVVSNSNEISDELKTSVFVGNYIYTASENSLICTSLETFGRRAELNF